MHWIEGKRLEMGIDTALQDAKTRQNILKSRNQWQDIQALREEFQEWFDGKTDPEQQEWLDHNNCW